jgi:hypothetical protein
MVAGHVPFDGPDFTTIFDHHLETAPARLDVVVRDCPHEFADLVDEMLAKNPEDRPPNAAIVADRLEQLLAGTSLRVSHDKLAALTETADAVAPNLTQRLHSGSAAEKSGMSWKIWVIIAAILAAISLFIVLE